MALNPKFTDLAVNTKVNCESTLLNAGKIAIYTGTQPATADTPIVSQTLLATLTFGNPAFGAGVAGVATANPITGATAIATGTATWFRAFKSDGTTPVVDGSAGTANANLILSTTSIVTGASVSAVSFTLTELKG